MRIELTRRIDDRPETSEKRWVLRGPHGAITWELRNGSYGPVGIHSPRPQWDEHEPDKRCPFLLRNCYVDRADVAGAKLGRDWLAAARDDEVIWRELASWYRICLIPRTQPVRRAS